MNLKDLPPALRQQAIEQYPDLGEKGKTISPSKYRNARAEFKGMTFASGHEAAVIAGLIKAEEQHKIFGLRLQVRFPLPGDSVYVADACWAELSSGELRFFVADAKGWDEKTQTYRMTPEFKRKRKLMKTVYGMDITLC